MDLMNRRLPGHFEEREILQMFAQICLGVAKMHYASPPIAHRDLKVWPQYAFSHSAGQTWP